MERRKCPRLGRVGYLTFMLLAMPATASATWWCAWFPWLFGCGVGSCGGGLTEVTDFGSNPGNLGMCRHVPDNLEASRPLVVALHGCRQQASSYDEETGWVAFAEEFRFALLLPQQRPANNGNRCFNWFELGDIERDRGEALSIRQMIAKTQNDLGTDPGMIFVTGLSAGGAMTSVMLATYPELFAGGAVIAGIPYRCATDLGEALDECGVSLSGRVAPMKDLSPNAWGDLVRNATGHPGPFPRVSIWQGTEDTTVNPVDQVELVDQWTDAAGIDQIADHEDTVDGHTRQRYHDGAGNALIETVLVDGMGHGTPVDPGDGTEPCGIAAPFILDVGVCSTSHILEFWGIAPP